GARSDPLQPDDEPSPGKQPQSADSPDCIFAESGGIPPTTEHPGDHAVGSIVAQRYRLVQHIGTGGMGTVWMAGQLAPLRRRVALKLIRSGLEHKEMIARFESERQALAMMKHDNIAKVYDGGSHAGQPFFVMEYVPGVPLTDYCDQRCLSVEARLELL